MLLVRVVLIAGLSFGVFSPARPAKAQDASSPTRLHCEGEAQYSLDPQIQMKTIRPPRSLPKSTRRMYRRELGPFDEIKYGFEGIEFVVERISSGEAESVSETNGCLKVRIKMVSTAGEKWLLLGEGSADRFRFDRPADLEEGPKGKNSFATVGQATPDPGVPIFVLGYSSQSMGMNTENSFASRELLDFRTQPPRVLMTLDCLHQEGGGACGALDTSNEAEDALDCNWAGELDGLVCDEVSNPGPWQSARRFVVGSKAVLPPPGKPEDPHDLAALAARAVDDPTWVEAHPVPIVEIGNVMALHVQPASESGVRPVLLGAPGHFFLATVRPDRQPEVRELHAGDIWRDLPPPPEKQPSTPGSRERGPHLPDFAPTFTPRFDLATVFHDESLTVLRVVASDGPGRTMFFIGIDRSGRKASTEALRLAATGSYYAGCGKTGHNPAAYAIRIGTKTRFSARAAVMPDISGGEGVSPVYAGEDDRTLANSTACAWRATVRWRSGAGFVTEHDRTRCLTVPGLSRVKIGRDGSVRLVKDPHMFDHDR